MRWQANVEYPSGSVWRQFDCNVEADDKPAAEQQVLQKLRERLGYRPYEWKMILLEPIPVGPFVHGTMAQDGGFQFPCGCWMEPKGGLGRCQVHEAGGSPGAEAIVEAVTALGLLKIPRPIYTCETCQTQVAAPPAIGPSAGYFLWPHGWETEEWSRKVGPGDWKYGKSTFCGRRCRGEWLIKTADDPSYRKP